MDTNSFDEGMKILDDRFKAGKETAYKTKMIYYDALCNIPAEPWLQIISRIVRGSRIYPTPAEITEQHRDWLREHPEKRIEDTIKTFCPECGGHGWLDFEVQVKELDNMWYSRIAKCARCDNYPFSKHVAKMTKQKILDIGGRFPEKKKPQKSVITRDIEKLINKTTRTT